MHKDWFRWRIRTKVVATIEETIVVNVMVEIKFLSRLSFLFATRAIAY